MFELYLKDISRDSRFPGFIENGCSASRTFLWLRFEEIGLCPKNPTRAKRGAGGRAEVKVWTSLFRGCSFYRRCIGYIFLHWFYKPIHGLHSVVTHNLCVRPTFDVSYQKISQCPLSETTDTQVQCNVSHSGTWESLTMAPSSLERPREYWTG